MDRNYLIGIGPITEVLVIYQFQKVLVLLRRSEVCKLYYFLFKYPNRKKTNQNHIRLT